MIPEGMVECVGGCEKLMLRGPATMCDECREGARILNRNAIERLAEERDAARENVLQAIQERDAALVKLAKVADTVKGYPEANALARRVRDIVAACPACAILGRIASASCTHLGRVRADS